MDINTSTGPIHISIRRKLILIRISLDSKFIGVSCVCVCVVPTTLTLTLTLTLTYTST